MKLLVVLPLLFITKSQAQTINCEERPKTSPHDCCLNMPKFLSDEVRSACGITFPLRASQDGTCEMNCAFEKLNLTSSGGINPDAVKKLVNTLYTGDWALPAMKALETCIVKVSPSGACPTRKAAECFIHGVIKNCPHSEWVASAECEKVKNFLKNCATFQDGDD